jgi:hypothetical protein
VAASGATIALDAATSSTRTSTYPSGSAGQKKGACGGGTAANQPHTS